MKAVVVGMGYVGVPLAVLLAEAGVTVTGIQRRSSRSGWKIEALNAGESPFGYPEPGLTEHLRAAVGSGRLHVTDDWEEASGADAVLLAPQTPLNPLGDPDLSALREATEAVAPKLREGALVSLESTVPPGTTLGLLKPTLEAGSRLRAGSGFRLAFSYERVMPGRLLHNLRRYPRVVGGYTGRCAEEAGRLYSLVTEAEVHLTDITTAEVSKLLENAHRDVNIGFANEAAMACEALGVDYSEVKRFVESLPDDPRDPSANPARRLLQPGGVGGHCLPKDSWLLAWGLRERGVDLRLMPAARAVNDGVPARLLGMIEAGLRLHGRRLESSGVTVLGAAYREETDDTRNSPALSLAELLNAGGCEVLVHDPYVDLLGGREVTRDLRGALKGSDCAVVVTGHRAYRSLAPRELAGLLRTPVVVDSRGVFDGAECERQGLSYLRLGAPPRWGAHP